MKITNLLIDWAEDWNQDPTLTLEVDKIPDVELLFEQAGPYIYAEHDGYLHFYVDSSNHDGYGGRKFHLPKRWGGYYDLKGPWSGNCRDFAKVFTDYEALDVFYKSHFPSSTYFTGGSRYGHPAACKLDLVKEALEKYHPTLCLAKHKYNKLEDGDWYYSVVCKDGRAKPFLAVDPIIVEAIATGEPRYWEILRKDQVEGAN